MLDINVSFLNISSKFVQTFVLSVNKLLHAWCTLKTSPATPPHLMTSQWRHR